eukprot:7099919-Alexandrium_andersonii.AAC.2
MCIRDRCAPQLDGFSWNMLGPGAAAPGSGPARAGAASSQAEVKTGKMTEQRVSRADLSDSHDAA